ncbi:MAG: DegT/DnrJ/EryC1/StrS family aminotransferase [candidate division Zixibacteria bacterium]|nr:DegT/DnrJ/EryC1/StrS family aminotransferase [candidate division Zixibacteria bacterium]
MKVPFFRLRLSAQEKKEVADALASGWITSGPKVSALEKGICALTGARHAVAVSSGTAGLHLALEALGITVGDQVITTPYTMIATIEAILYTGAEPVLVDIDAATLNIDPALIESKITRKTKAIVAVDIAGCPCDYRRLRAIARKYHLALIADAAHSLGADYRGQAVGTLADATVFSFYSTKNLTTGEGGMVLTGRKRLADEIRLLALHGMTSSGWKRYAGGSWKYDVVRLGYKYNLSDVSAALGLGQLRGFEKRQAKRAGLANRYNRKLADLGGLLDLPFCPDGSNHAWHLYVIRPIPERWGISRDRLIVELENRGVGCGVHFIPIHTFTHVKKILPVGRYHLPICEREAGRAISLPLYPDLTLREADYVCEVIHELAKRFVG